ncbi:hypothetical protein BBR47_07730 [Brevibacillus brevis NBRC 100599]|uniref:Uncharacterized protein n=1 Tax=Brevibacillus brevis (strain 47 / JCM 6285 / NBRC 100599) TaxID=358681 RepID=C0Z4M3_BREBN|nr:hypothetical protein BBR47_07730 [Brevibacillus brevis NBRC 100599]
MNDRFSLNEQYDINDRLYVENKSNRKRDNP